MIDEVADKVKNIRERLRAAQSRQKSYADIKRRPLEFEEGDHVFIKVFPLKGSVRFGRRVKLNPRYIGPFQIMERIGPVSYTHLTLPTKRIV